ncbi:MAG: superoxide dismutase [Nocardioides sp.]
MTRLGRLTQILSPGLAAGLLVAALAAPAGARPFPDQIPLPNGFQPEGIATGRGPTAYVGSLADGDIRALNLRTGAGRTISEGDGTQAVGMKLDHRGRLWVAGGADGDAKVVDTRTGKVLATYDFADAPTFVNDVVLSKGAAWFTDSQRAVLYRVPAGRKLTGEPSEVPLGGDWQQVAGFNANGITTTPDGRALLVVQSATGYLFRVHPRTGTATRVDLGGYLLSNGDGLLVDGRKLYAVQNRENKVAVLRLCRSGLAGRLVDTLTSPTFDVPTTVAKFGRALYLPNARFGNPEPTTATYSVTRVER